MNIRKKLWNSGLNKIGGKRNLSPAFEKAQNPQPREKGKKIRESNNKKRKNELSSPRQNQTKGGDSLTEKKGIHHDEGRGKRG